MTKAEFKNLKGKTLSSVTAIVGDDSATFTCTDGTVYRMGHEQDCCESVSIEDVCGDLADLVGTPILSASERESDKNPQGFKPSTYQESFTWTFYRLSTIKGTVVIRWYGESNGYYSESVDFIREDVCQVLQYYI